MKFQGFPARAQFTPVPNVFLNQLAPELPEGELRLMLAVFGILYGKKGYPRYATEAEIAGHPAISKLKGIEGPLCSLTDKGLLLPLTVTQGVEGRTLYFLNSPADREARERLSRGEVKLEEYADVKAAEAAPAPPDIFTLYEENIGLITPMIAEELKDALATYREDWIREAVREAVSLNKRSWRYILRILERWATEGKTDGSTRLTINGTHRQDIERDANRYVRGRYGKLVQR